MEFFNMSQKELDRFTIISKVKDGQLTQVKASQILGISDRQLRNILRNFDHFGAQGLISKLRGKTSNRKSNLKLKMKILELIRETYSDFGPTLAVEKLKENHNIHISRETLRKWMIEIHLWIPKIKRKKRRPLRKRREYFGEMIQGDGSHHDWFENGQPCVLLIFIDDATSKITAARFEKTECLEGYFELLQQHMMIYGRPISLYTDRFSVFESTSKKENLTQFQRALHQLDIKWIGANSPQAKGRVERCNRTLQDRLIKEMRIRGVKSIEAGNAFLEEYLLIFNDKFSKKPMKKVDLHRLLEQGIDLSRTLSKYEERTLTKDLTFQFHSIHYKVFEPINCSGKIIEIRTDRKGKLRVFLGSREVEFCRLNEFYEDTGKIIKLEKDWTTRAIKSQEMEHPWKKYTYMKLQKEKEIKMYKRL